MILLEIVGDLFDYDWHKADAICITTNGFVKADGSAVMGRGCAREAVILWPGIEKVLGEKILRSGNRVMRLTYYPDDERIRLLVPNNPVPYHVFSFPVKHNWWEKADLDLIKRSAEDLKAMTLHMNKIVIPRPGCGNGGLEWSDVRPVLEPILESDKFCIISPI